MSNPSRAGTAAATEHAPGSSRGRGAPGVPPRGARPAPARRPAGGGAAPAGNALHVDWTRCDGHGLCAELLPELLQRDEWGYPIARSGAATRNVPVPQHLLPYAGRAVDACPRLALRLRPAHPGGGPGAAAGSP
jgi:ferredoxin